MNNKGKTEIQITKDLTALGVREGGALLVHTSLRSLGPVAGGAETVVRGLLRALGENGTLLGRVDELRKEDIYRDEMNKCYKHLG